MLEDSFVFRATSLPVDKLLQCKVEAGQIWLIIYPALSLTSADLTHLSDKNLSDKKDSSQTPNLICTLPSSTTPLKLRSQQKRRRTGSAKVLYRVLRDNGCEVCRS